VAVACPCWYSRTDIELYLSCFEWGLLLVTGMDVEPATGPYPPTMSQSEKLRRHEVIIRTGCVITGALIWTYVTAAFVEVIVNTDPDHIEFRNRLEDLNRYIVETKVPLEHAQKLREYLERTKHVSVSRSRQRVLGMHVLCGSNPRPRLRLLRLLLLRLLRLLRLLLRRRRLRLRLRLRLLP
jgi:hypothetical protein